MKRSALALVLCSILVLAACGGGNSHSGSINGLWTATLSDVNGDTVFGFTTNFVQQSGSSLQIVNFQFTTNSPCFANEQLSETASFVLAGDFNGNVTGQLQMTVSTTFPSNNNVLTLNGAANGNTITGTWTLSGGTGCSGNGTFNMTRR